MEIKRVEWIGVKRAINPSRGTCAALFIEDENKSFKAHQIWKHQLNLDNKLWPSALEWRAPEIKEVKG